MWILNIPPTGPAVWVAYVFRPESASVMAQGLAARMSDTRTAAGGFGEVRVCRDDGVSLEGYFWGSGKQYTLQPPATETAGLIDDWHRFIEGWAANWWRR